MIYVNPFNDLMASNGSNQSASKFVLANCLSQSSQAPAQVRSASTSSSISSASTSPQMTPSQINTKSKDLSQLMAKNLSIQTSLFSTYPTSAYTYLNSNFLYAQPNRLVQNSANFGPTFSSLSEKSILYIFFKFYKLLFFG